MDCVRYWGEITFDIVIQMSCTFYELVKTNNELQFKNLQSIYTFPHKWILVFFYLEFVLWYLLRDKGNIMSLMLNSIWIPIHSINSRYIIPVHSNLECIFFISKKMLIILINSSIPLLWFYGLVCSLEYNWHTCILLIYYS